MQVFVDNIITPKRRHEMVIRIAGTWHMRVYELTGRLKRWSTRNGLLKEMRHLERLQRAKHYETRAADLQDMEAGLKVISAGGDFSATRARDYVDVWFILV